MSNDDNDPAVAVGDHLRPADAAHQPGIYRVVGASDRIALLRVTDGDGHREATGDLLVVPAADLSGFEPATDPDAGLHPLRWARGLLSGMYWELRSLLP